MAAISKPQWCCVVALLWLLNAISAAPSDANSPARKFSGSSPATFSVPLVRDPYYSRSNLTNQELLRAYAAPFYKFNMTMPAKLRAALNKVKLESGPTVEARQTTEVTVNAIAGDVGLFLVPITIGTPPQTSLVIFDTGSWNLVVNSWLMEKTGMVSKNFYDATRSTTSFRMQGQNFSANYYSGYLQGLVWADNLWVGDIGVIGNPIECAVTTTFGAYTFDGFLGLSPKTLDDESPNRQETWLAYVMPYLAAPLFTTSFHRLGSDYTNSTGTVDFGYIDTSKFHGTIRYAPVVSGSDTWTFQSSGYSPGNGIFYPYPFKVVVDTGTNYNLLPSPICESLYANIPGAYENFQGFWFFPCDSILPSFSFGVGNTLVNINPSTFIWQDQGNNECVGSWLCGTSSGGALFGVPALDELFVVFDYGNKQIGFVGQ